jgi:hypothetical protein
VLDAVESSLAVSQILPYERLGRSATFRPIVRLPGTRRASSVQVGISPGSPRQHHCSSSKQD